MTAVLVGREVVLEPNMGKWARGMSRDRRVALDMVGDVKVSTVFLGLDHGFDGVPMWFETMVFGGDHDGWQDRYTTWDEAERGHAAAVAMVKWG